MSDPEDIEILAAAEHESWSGWTRWMLGEIGKESNGGGFMAQYGMPLGRFKRLLNALPCVQRWRRQMGTPYAELSEREKESDRKEAREKLKTYRPTSVVELELGLTAGEWDEIKNGRLIAALRLVRDRTGMNLKESKAFIDKARAEANG